MATPSGFAGRSSESGDSRPARRGETTGSNRVKRGGSWNNNAQNCRAANRNNNDPGNRNNNLGFRPTSSRHSGCSGAPRPEGSRLRTRPLCQGPDHALQACAGSSVPTMSRTKMDPVGRVGLDSKPPRPTGASLFAIVRRLRLHASEARPTRSSSPLPTFRTFGPRRVSSPGTSLANRTHAIVLRPKVDYQSRPVSD